MFRVKTRSPLTESKKKKCEAMTGSLPRKMQLQRVSVLCWYQTQVAQLTATHLNRWAMGSCRSTEKNGILLKVFRNLQPLFCVQDCRSWIVQDEYLGQARNTIILECKLLIDASWRIASDFARFLLIAHRAAHRAQKKKARTEKFNFKTDLRNQVMDDCSVTL